MRPDLSILCVTKCEPEILHLLNDLSQKAERLDAEFVIVIDESHGNGLHLNGKASKILTIRSNGYIESVLDEAISHTTGDYILRIDDDESLSGSLFEWLDSHFYLEQDHWKFARAHLYPDTSHFITNPPLWQDHQTRLSIREKAGNRPNIHSGSPFGGGKLAPYPIFHHKFLVKSHEKRAEIVKNYDKISPGMGTNFAIFSVPEDVISEINVEKVENLRVF